MQKAQKDSCWQGALLRSPFREFVATESQKLHNHDEKRHLLYKCVHQIWRLYIIFEVINEEKYFDQILVAK